MGEPLLTETRRNDNPDDILSREARAPRSTYRLQMHRNFRFADALPILDYLHQLGIGDLYSSPVFEARPGSMHGYDVTRHDRFNPELGGEEGFEQLSAELERKGMGLLLDIVPNHMGVGNDSVWWQDVLENGRASAYSDFFDIDWNPLKPAMRNKLLLPILGNQYGIELENKKIQIAIQGGRAVVQYYDHTMPVAPRPLAILFREQDDAANGVPQDFRNLLKQLPEIPPHETTDEELRSDRRARLNPLMQELRAALASPQMQSAIQKTLEDINGIAGYPATFDRLHQLLEAQPYRLALWRTSAEEINYRRFFDVNDLVGLRMENPVVFAETHCLVRRLLANHQVTGLRIDHCDGMFNPRQYLIRLQLLYLASQISGPVAIGETAANGIERSVLDQVRGYDWSKSRGPLYTVVEKILEPREYLPNEWPVSGTSGYDFAYLANAIFIRPENEEHFNSIYARTIGSRLNPDQIVYQSKLQVMQTALASEVYALTNLLSHIASENRYARDFTDNILETVIRQTIANFPVYRTYIDDRGQYSERDTAFIRSAIARAKRLNPDVDASAFDFLRETLLLRSMSPRPERQLKLDPRILHFALKFQQLTGPVMAKGVEDTAFYVYNRFLSSNEVGSSIKSFGISLDTFHESNQERLRYSPDSMLTTSTHDSKRSEDVRNRLNVLSEIPQVWSTAVHRWQRMNAKFKRTLEDGRVAPDANEEYLIYQTILGAWPWQMDTADQQKDFLERIRQYASKALSEAKINMSWINPDPAYEEAVGDFLSAVLNKGRRGKSTPFVESLAALMPRLRLFGAVNSLAQVILKVACPGVPDFYQGSELWDLSLVDPDNRRPVDYNLRRDLLDRMLASIEQDGLGAVAQDVIRDLSDGRAKLFVTQRALFLRSRQPELFRRGEYIPLICSGAKAEHAIAFLRRNPATGQCVLAFVPRFACTLMQGEAALPLGEAWQDTRVRLPEPAMQSFMNVFTGETMEADQEGGIAISTILSTFPVGLFVSSGRNPPPKA